MYSLIKIKIFTKKQQLKKCPTIINFNKKTFKFDILIQKINNN